MSVKKEEISLCPTDTAYQNQHVHTSLQVSGTRVSSGTKGTLIVLSNRPRVLHILLLVRVYFSMENTLMPAYFWNGRFAKTCKK